MMVLTKVQKHKFIYSVNVTNLTANTINTNSISATTFYGDGQ